MQTFTYQTVWLLVTLLALLSAPAPANEKFAIVIHGGAGGDPSNWSESYREQRRVSLTKALDRGLEMLEDGKSAMDVVEAVVRLMEDDPIFNAGRGCVLNEKGEHELDASIMDGQSLRCGAVGSVRTTKHPISLARKVMEETRHILLIGNGADQFATLQGLESADADYFRTEQQKQKLNDWKAKQGVASTRSNKPANSSENYFGTVGCVVLDSQGNLAAGTSTGGLLGKKWGRVGDSPIIGAGNYADNQTCAVSGTGIGEEFIRRSLASDVAARMRYGGRELPLAAAEAVEWLPENGGGIIAVDPQGNMVMEFNTQGMSRAFANSDGDRGVLLGREE